MERRIPVAWREMTFKGPAVLATIALVGLIGGILIVARTGGSTDAQGRIAEPAGDERSLVERRDSLQPLESSLPAPDRRTGSRWIRSASRRMITRVNRQQHPTEQQHQRHQQCPVEIHAEQPGSGDADQAPQRRNDHQQAQPSG